MAVPLDNLLLAAIAALSLLGFVLAVRDKRAARAGQERVPESAFHLLALVGGWPGCFLGFAVMHHKTRKLRFLLPFVLASAANLAVILLLLDRS